MEFIKQNLKSILIILVLTLGLIVSVYLVGQKTIFKSRANLELYNTITVSEKGADGVSQTVDCTPTESGQDCQVESENIELNINLEELENLAPD